MGKIPDNPHQIWNMSTRPYLYGPTRQGETVRKCVECGGEYEPTGRTQKYCPECRAERKRNR